MRSTLADEPEVHPEAFVTVKVYVPAGSPDTVVVVPVPVVVVPPGFRVSVQVPEDGNPLIAALPVGTVHVGWVIAPITGAVGTGGCALITTLADDPEVHPDAFVTVKVYVPGTSPVTVVVVPVPVDVPPGVLVNVHVPEEGKPFSTTIPVATVHVG